MKNIGKIFIDLYVNYNENQTNILFRNSLVLPENLRKCVNFQIILLTFFDLGKVTENK